MRGRGIGLGLSRTPIPVPVDRGSRGSIVVHLIGVKKEEGVEGFVNGLNSSSGELRWTPCKVYVRLRG